MIHMLLRFLLVALLAYRGWGHAYLMEPPARNLLKHRSSEENCPHCLQSGGPSEVKARGNGIWPTMNDPASHGLCGDPKQLSPEPASIADMKYMEASAPQRTYVAGSIAEFTIHISTHHMGHFEFRICDRVLDRSLASPEVGQQCLNGHVLRRAPRSESCGDSFMRDCQPLNPNHPERWYLPPADAATEVAEVGSANTPATASVDHGEVYVMRYVIPDDLSCEHCTVQWYYATGNSCAYDEDYFIFDPGFKFFYAYDSMSSWGTCSNTCCGPKGNGAFGEEFWNCADVKVIGASVPVTTAPPTGVPTPVPTTTVVTETPTSTATTTTSIQTTSTTTPAPQLEIQSGDTIFLKTHSGEGNMLHVEGHSVQAKWQDRGDWQAFRIHKNGGGGSIQSGDTIFLTGHTGAQVDVEGEAVQARWEAKGPWQSLTVEKADGEGALFPGDVVCFMAHATGKHIDVEDDTARARWTDRCGFWQGMRIERKDEGLGVSSGDDVYLMAHTGKLIEVEGDSVGARWTDHGLWQRLRIENEAGGAIHSGDAIFLTAHTSKMLEVQSTMVRARYTDRGDWQKFVIVSAGGGAISTGETIFLKAHTGNFVDVEGVVVSVRWNEQGLWQSFSLEKHSRRALQQTSRAVAAPTYTDDALLGPVLGVVIGLLATAFMVSLIVMLAGRKLHRWQLLNRECPPTDRKVHPSTDHDDIGSD